MVVNHDDRRRIRDDSCTHDVHGRCSNMRGASLSDFMQGVNVIALPDEHGPKRFTRVVAEQWSHDAIDGIAGIDLACNTRGCAFDSAPSIDDFTLSKHVFT